MLTRITWWIDSAGCRHVCIVTRVASMKKDTGEKIGGGYVASTKRTPGRLVHKRPEGEVAAARAPQGKSSGAGAQPELPVCEQAGFVRSQAALKRGLRFW